MADLIRLSEDSRGHLDKDQVLTVDPEGTTWVAWHSYRPKMDRILARSLHGRKKGTILEVSGSSGNQFQPRIACDTAGKVWIAWTSVTRGQWSIQVRPIFQRGMGRTIRLVEQESETAFPAISAGEDGRVWVAWSSIHNGKHQIFGCSLSDGNWSSPQQLSQGPAEHFRPVLCAGTKGVWLTYQTLIRGSYDLHLNHWGSRGLSNPKRYSLTDSWELFPRLCSDGQNGVWATWIATHDVTNSKGFVDHKVEAMASHFDGKTWKPYQNSDSSKPEGYVTHLCDGILARKSYMGFVGWRRRPQIVREKSGSIWLVYERKENEGVNAQGPDALFYARPLTGPGQNRTYEVDKSYHAYTVNSDLPIEGGHLPISAQVSAGKYYADICAGTVSLDRSRPIRQRPSGLWRDWKPIRLPGPKALSNRPTRTINGKVYKLYWGDPHCHGNLSGDAEGEIDENYSYGRYKSQLDFMAVTDNDAIYDNILTPSELSLVVAEANHFNDPGRFVAIPAYERTYRRERKKGPNHRIMLFPDSNVPLYHYTEPDAYTLEKWVAKMEKTRAFTFPHHATWWAIPSSTIGGVELCSCWDIYIQDANTIPDNLKKGFRLAFMGNSDSHRIVPGQGGALTGVWAESLTREGIFEALWARRCFATNGERLDLDVRVNGQFMGSEVENSGEVTLSCRINSPRVIKQVDLFRNGEKISQHTVNRKQALLKLSDLPKAGEHFYYVQITLSPLPRKPMGGRCGNLQVAKGDFAWSSPIWVKQESR